MKTGIAGLLAQFFINSKLTPLIIVASTLLGVGATFLLPREEEPQIKVPMIDVMVSFPGASAKEVEERLTRPMEKLILEIPGVEYVYSVSKPDSALAIVRFHVGEDEERSMVRLNQKLSANFDIIPPGASKPLVKPRSIDDVPILAITFWSDKYSSYDLRRVAAQVTDSVKEVPDVSETTLIGGNRRVLKVELDPTAMAAHNLAPAMLVPIIQGSNRQSFSGTFTSDSKEIRVETGGFFKSADDLASLVVGVHDGAPVFLRDVASIRDEADEPKDYVFMGVGKSAYQKNISDDFLPGSTYLAVTLAVSKRKGTNAIQVAGQVLRKIETLKGTVIPFDIKTTITRNYGETAAEKSNELLFHMGIAIVSVTLLIMFTLGVRESSIVAIAIPVTLSLTLLVFYLYGYTLNRITLFALIFSIGILVDDAIVVVENIVRHQNLPGSSDKSISQIAIEAVSEVGNPTILATFAVIGAILPMAFVSGLMGPYMRPIPVGSSAAMFFSLIVACVVTPWAAIRLLKSDSQGHEKGPGKEDISMRLYRKVMGLLIHRRPLTWSFLAFVVLLLIGSLSMVPLKQVTVKMLPFDNKSEFQVMVDLPEDTPLADSVRLLRELGLYLANISEVSDYQIYAGTSSPYNFNGLVRHYFLRRGSHVGEIQVNLVPKHSRTRQSHEIAKGVRAELKKIADLYGAKVQIAEVPPGPPVLQTIVAEIYGPDSNSRLDLARKVKTVFEETDGVVDVDWYIEDDVKKVRFEVDKLKARLSGVGMAQIDETLLIAVSGKKVGLIHDPDEKEDLNIVLGLPVEKRSHITDFSEIQIMGAEGGLVPLGEILTRFEEPVDKAIYHKNGMPVIYITGDVSGTEESPVYAILKMMNSVDGLEGLHGTPVNQFSTELPYFETSASIKWDGEWHITYEVFRDMGLAFAVVLVLIYTLMVGWFQSYRLPFIIMSAIPFSLVGILPAHWGMGAFFTATSMIGFIAGAGIVVRNSIILVDFIEMKRAEGVPLDLAVIEAGAVRFRPMLLTAAAVIVGASVILFDPIFQGLAISLMAGEIASLLLSRMMVPILYYLEEK